MLELTFEEDASDPSSDASLPLGLTNSSVAQEEEFGGAHGRTPGERTSSATATATAFAGPAATAAPLPTSDDSSSPQRNLTIGVLQESEGEEADASSKVRGRRGVSTIILDRAANLLREEMMLKNKSDESTVCGKIGAWFELVGISGNRHRLVRGVGAFVGAFTLIVPLLTFQVFMLATFVLHCTPLAVMITDDEDGKVTKY
jgi:hypothetical protein